jgi:hypothetical protein
MGIDINKIKAKLNQIKSKPNSLWKPSGTHVIRIVPYIKDPSNPFQELLFHYKLNGKTFLSPETYKRPDPLVELSEKLKGNAESKEEWKQGARLAPKMRIYVPIIVRGEEKEGVKFWGFGKEVYEELLGFISDPDYGDITDPKTGRDITIEFTPAKDSKKKNPNTGEGIPETAIRIKPNVSPLIPDGNKELLEIVKNQKDITELFPEPTYEELKAELVKWLDSESGDEEKSTSQTDTQSEKVEKVETQAKGESTKKNSAASLADISNAFDEMFSN